MSANDPLEMWQNDRENMREFFQRHRTLKHATDLVLKMTIRAKLGHKYKRGDGVGFLEGSIIANPLAHPEEGQWITLTQTQPGKWLGHDFKWQAVRDKENKERKDRIFEGRLGAFVLDQVMDNNPEDETPVGLLDILNLDHLLTFDTYTPAQLTEFGLLSQTSYAEAYRKVNAHDQFGEELLAKRVAEDPVYQITPKGNTLVLLLPDMGQPKPKEEPESELFLVPALRGIYS